MKILNFDKNYLQKEITYNSIIYYIQLNITKNHLDLINENLKTFSYLIFNFLSRITLEFQHVPHSPYRFLYRSYNST